MNTEIEKYILLVDDNTVDLRSTHQLLVNLGYDVTSTTDSQEALSFFRNEPDKFDMIITDQFMPRMKGHELVISVREIRKDIPVIVCSGSDGALQELQEQMRDFQEFLLKPFSRSELTDTIHRILT
ncbi:MAG: response regulator [Desulfomonilia bacterium]|jgi:CheY-like chemotaxis protein